MDNKVIKIDGIYGYLRCPSWLKHNFRISVHNICPRCKKHENECGTLQVHRKKRKGLYTVLPLNHKKSNCDIDCRSCHNKLHSNEYPWIKSK